MPTEKPNMSEKPQSKPAVPKKPHWFPIAQFVIALILLAGFLYLVSFMLEKAGVKGMDAETWMRMVFVYTGYETIIFSVIAFIFGSAVQAPRVLEARANAQAANTRADEEAKKGSTLAAAVKGKDKFQFKTLGQASGDDNLDQKLKAIEIVAESLYPES